MNTFHLLGVAALVMLSACASSNRESRVQYSTGYHASKPSPVAVKQSISPVAHPRYKSEEKLMACGQVLSFWAGHLR